MADKPNVLIVTTDQQRADSLSAYGSAHLDTPNLDRLAAEGALFERAYCANPVCTPARASIFSGRYLSRHGAWNVGMNVPEDERFISHILAERGYRTHYIGKAHFQSMSVDDPETHSSHENLRNDWQSRYSNWHGPYYGFETVELSLGHASYGMRGHYGLWLQSQMSSEEYARCEHSENLHAVNFGGNACDWDLPVAYHSSVWVADRTVEFLKTHDESKPFCLAIGFQDPHHPHCVPKEYEKKYDPAAMPLPDYTEGELNDKPPHFLQARTDELRNSEVRGKYPVAGMSEGMQFERVTDDDARKGRAYYYSMVRMIDDQMGRIMDALDKQGLADNTIVVFTSDHGELLGDHGLWMKGPMHYESLIRIPMIIRYPKRFKPSIRSDALISQVDIVPTVLDALDEPIPDGIDGVSLAPVSAGETDAVRNSVLVECVDDPDGLRLKTIVRDGVKLTAYTGKPYGELYDLKNDPGEKVNHWNDPAYAAIKADLLGEIIAYLEPLEPRVERIAYA